MTEKNQPTADDRRDGHLTDPEEESGSEPTTSPTTRAPERRRMKIVLNRPTSIVQRLFNETPDGDEERRNRNVPLQSADNRNAEQTIASGKRVIDGRSLPVGGQETDPSFRTPLQETGERSPTQEVRPSEPRPEESSLQDDEEAYQEGINRSLVDQLSVLSKQIGILRAQRHDSPAERPNRERKTGERDEWLPVEKGSRVFENPPSSSRKVSFGRATFPYPSDQIVDLEEDDLELNNEEIRRTDGRRSKPSENQEDPRAIKSLRREVEQMKSMVRRATSSAPEMDDLLAETENSPFTERITRRKVPLNDKLRLPTYDGKDDPSVFLRGFNVKVGRADFGRATDDQGRCQLFVESLRGEAQAWFTRLPENSIDSFEDLKAAFLSQYLIFRELPPTTYELCNIAQGSRETLKEFVQRFKDLYSKLRISDSLAIEALTNAVRKDSRLYSDLVSRKPLSINDAFYQAHMHIRMEEQQGKLSDPVAALKVPKSSRSDEWKEPRQHYDKDNRKKERSREGASLAVTDQKTKKPWTEKANEGPKDHSPPWCAYHEKHYHRTEDCRQLKEELMRRYLKERSETRPSSPDRQRTKPKGNPAVGSDGKRERDKDDQQLPPPPPPRQRIDMIMGELVDSGDSIRSIQRSIDRIVSEHPQKEKLFQKELRFTAEDLEGIAVPHNDLLVVELQVGDCDVRRILIDTGSSVDVIGIPTLQKMGVSANEIKPKSKILTAFGGETVCTVGTIKLPVSAGGVTKIVKFDVVEKATIYNAILGTPWLYSMKAVASTYHQCVKFPTPKGYFAVRGDQRMSRKCFVINKKNRAADGSSAENADDSSEEDLTPSNHRIESTKILQELLRKTEQMDGTSKLERHKI